MFASCRQRRWRDKQGAPFEVQYSWYPVFIINTYLFISLFFNFNRKRLLFSKRLRQSESRKCSNRSSDCKPSVGLFKPVTPLPSRRKAILFLRPDLTRLSVSLPTFFECSPHCLANAVTSPLAVWVEVGLQKARRKKKRAAFCAAASQKAAVAHDFTTDDLMAAERRHSHSDANTHSAAGGTLDRKQLWKSTLGSRMLLNFL